MDLHRLAEQRSLAIHAEVARRLERDPAILDHARDVLARWISTGRISSHYAGEWQRELARPLPEIAALLLDDGERARALRQASPFVGIVGPRERWKLWRSVRAESER